METLPALLVLLNPHRGIPLSNEEFWCLYAILDE